MLLIGALLVLILGIAHSWLGERYILMRLFRRPLPELFGSDEFTRNTLRFAWHITTVAWFGLAALLLQVEGDSLSRATVLTTIGVTFGLSAAISLIAGRGRHYSWLVFTAIAVCCFLSA